MLTMVATERKPSIEEFHPNWWHHHGTKVKVVVQFRALEKVVMAGSAAELVISREKHRWRVDWAVRHSYNEHVVGSTTFSNEALQSAFGFYDFSHDAALWMIQRFGGTAAEQGTFIRWKRFLNIPGPGTGHDGDTNISLYLRDTTIVAVAHLLGMSEEVPQERLGEDLFG